MELIDSHAHISSETVYPHIDDVLTRSKENGVKSIINICTDRLSLERGLELASKNSWVYNTAATTPHDVEKEGEELWPIMEQAAKDGKLVAVGETGLDYYYTHSSPEIQQQFLRRYLQLARDCDLPVVIHCRDAFADFFRILDEEFTENGKHLPGVLHCFTGTLDEAKEVIARGWYLSLSGIVTFKRSEELREVAKIVPIDQLLIETDSPYLAPQGKRGKMNEPSFLTLTAQFIAELKNMSLEELAEKTAKNSQQLFRIN